MNVADYIILNCIGRYLVLLQIIMDIGHNKKIYHTTAWNTVLFFRNNRFEYYVL